MMNKDARKAKESADGRVGVYKCFVNAVMESLLYAPVPMEDRACRSYREAAALDMAKALDDAGLKETTR